MTLTSLLLGTRGSRLALAQTELVLAGLRAAHPALAVTFEIIKTSGDWKPEDGERRLAENEGGKGLFVKEIEQAILATRVHAGVHSLKDVPSFLPEGLGVDITLPRADARDVFICRDGDDLMSLKAGAVIGTASLRRQAIVKKLRPDLQVVPLRGNVPTRLDKLRQGQVDAIILANAGMSRLGPEIMPLNDIRCTLLDTAMMLPACGQGIIGIETRLMDDDVRQALFSIHHANTGICAAAERKILQILDGSCQTPIGAYATLVDGSMHVRSIVAMPDGTGAYQAERQGSVRTVDDAVRLAADLGAEMRAHAPAGLLPECRTGT